jgi:hypothetical protein
MSTTLLTRTQSGHRASAPAFLHPRIWHASAPAAASEAGSGSTSSDDWPTWRKHLATRKQPASLIDLFGPRRSSLLWGTATLPLTTDSRDLLATLSRTACGHRAAGRTAAEVLQPWLAESEGNLTLEPVAVQSMAWAYALPALAAFVSAGLWWELLELLVSTASEARRPADYESPLARQLWEAELPLVLAWLLPEILPCRGLGAAGARRLGESLRQSANEDELLAPRSISALRARLASWIRSLIIARQTPELCEGDAGTSLSAVLLTALRLTRPGGRQVFDDEEDRDQPLDLFRSALAEANDPQVRGAMACLPGQRRKKRVVTTSPLAACHSEQAEFALLRRGWAPDGELFAVRYDGGKVHCELSAGRELIAAGKWSIELRADGKPLQQRSDWDQVCWVSDKDVDYLELETRFTGGVRVQRQMLLAREDRFLYLADAVLGQAECHLQYRGLLPLGPDIEVQPADETREMALVGRRRCLVQPLALPEWRRDSRGGSLAHVDAGLELLQQRTGRRMYAPLLIDLDPRRARQPLTWRQLTVAEDRKSVSGDVAAGYRVQIGRRQWLIYRSLAERANRTLLGANLSTEFLFARFSPDGEAQPLLEIE